MMSAQNAPSVGRGALGAVVVLAALSIARAGSAQSYANMPYTRDEALALPRACLAQNIIVKTLNGPVLSETEMQQWQAQLTPGFEHIHHYCWGLMQMARATRAEKEMDRNASYRSAIRNFDYVIRNWTPAYPLTPDAHFKKGIALRFLGSDAGAATEFLNAIRAKSDFSPPYAALADLQADLGNVDEARQTVELGLANAPNSKLLAAKRAELDAHVGAEQK